MSYSVAYFKMLVLLNKCFVFCFSFFLDMCKFHSMIPSTPPPLTKILTTGIFWTYMIKSRYRIRLGSLWDKR